MTVLTESTLQKELKSKKTRLIYFIYGNENFKIKKYTSMINKIRSESDKIIYYGDELVTKNMDIESQNLSLFKTEKTFIIRQSELISKKQWEKVLSILENSSKENCFVFLAKKMDARQTYGKSLTKESKAAVVHCKAADRREFMAWAKFIAKENGKQINATAIQALLEYGGLSLDELSHSIKKIALYMGDNNDSIQDMLVKEIIEQTKLDIVFEYSDSIMQRNQKKALKQILSLYEQGEEPIAIIGLLGRQYRLMMNILSRTEKGQSIDRISRELRVSPFLARKLLPLSKQKGYKRIRNGLELLTLADKELKTSAKTPMLVLNTLSIALSKF